MDIKDKTILITGATSGIGYETALAMAKGGAQLVITARNIEKGEQIKQRLISASGNEKIEMFECQLDELSSVRAFAGKFMQKYSKLHILINNAGMWETKRRESKDGIELTFAVNHLAPFLLTTQLLDHIKSSAPARIINLASAAHKFAKIDFDDIEGKKKWGSMQSYGQSKLCNILFTKKLAQMLKGSGVTVNCVHPGVVNTHLFDKMPRWMMGPFSSFLITPAKGAQTSIYLATSSDVENISGEYFAKSKVKRSNKESRDQQKADKLWDLSKEYISKFASY